MTRLCANSRIGRVLVVLVVLGSRPARAGPNDLYVDSTLASASCSTYSPAARSCSGGAERAFRTVAGAAAATAPGITVHLRAGTYSEQLAPPASGVAGQPITYRSYTGEQ